MAWLDAPKAVVGIVIAALVLLPEGMAAVKAARANQLQTSLNLALGSALASIGLTIPAVAVVAIVLDQRLELGLTSRSSACSRSRCSSASSPWAPAGPPCCRASSIS